MVQWLRLCTPNAVGVGLIPARGTRSHMFKLRVLTPQLKILRATTKTQSSHINLKKKCRSHQD